MSKPLLQEKIRQFTELQGELRDAALEALVPGTSVYWYTQRSGQYFMQEGEVLLNCCATDTWNRAVKVKNLKTNREVWLSLFDLSFWIQGTERMEVAA